MASVQERAALMKVSCPWCKAAPAEECSTLGPAGRRLPVNTLDGGCHDARWQKALGESARVVLPEHMRVAAEARQPTPAPEREPVSVGAAMPTELAERPW